MDYLLYEIQKKIIENNQSVNSKNEKKKKLRTLILFEAKKKKKPHFSIFQCFINWYR